MSKMCKKCKEVVKEVAVSASQKRAVAALRRAEQRQVEKLKYTVGVYVPFKKDHGFGLPYCAPSDEIASQSFRSCVDQPDGSALVNSDLWRIADYNFKTGELKLLKPRKFITY